MKRFEGTEQYVATADLQLAVNAAVNLQRPLLIKGEPGTGKTMLAEEVAGAVGLVSMAAHLVGDELAAIIAAVDAGDLPSAIEGFVAIQPVVDLICGSGNGALRSKLTLHLLGHLPSAAMRLPQVEADATEIAEVRAALEAAGLL